MKTVAEHIKEGSNHGLCLTSEAEADLNAKGDWLVLPTGRNRDSEAIDESNFHAALERLGGESDTVEVHRFGHWACGWYELIFTHPMRLTEVESLVDDLENYPLLDEDDLSERESNERWEAWHAWGHDSFVDALGLAFGLSDTTVEFLRDRRYADGTLHLHDSLANDDSGPAFHFYSYLGGQPGYEHWPTVERLTRDWLARFILAFRYYDRHNECAYVEVVDSLWR